VDLILQTRNDYNGTQQNASNYWNIFVKKCSVGKPYTYKLISILSYQPTDILIKLRNGQGCGLRTSFNF